MFDLKKYKETEAAIQKTAELRKSVRQAVLNLPPELEGLLPTEIGDPGNKLPLDLQGVDNKVWLYEILYDPNVPVGRPISVQLLWDGNPVGPVIEGLMTPIDPVNDLPVELFLPGLDTQAPGRHQLSYRSVYVINTYDGPEVEIIIDKEAPNHDRPGSPPILPDVLDGVIDKQYFDNNQTVTVEIPRPLDRATGDIATIYFGKSAPGKLVGIVRAEDNSPANLTYDVPVFDIATAGEGNMIFYYVWEDRVGNVGPPSDPLDVIVLLSNAPSGLRPPEVPMAVGPNKTVNIAASFPTLAVRIREYVDFEVNIDKVVVKFDDITQPERTVTGATDVIVEVPYSNVARNGRGPRLADVNYKVVRYNSEFEELIGETIEIDLTLPGPPPDPGDENPDIGNPNLTQVVVTGRGNPPSPPDTLELQDFGLIADASAILYDNFQAGDEVRLYWNEQLVPAPGGLYEVTGLEAIGDPMPFEIPWDMIEATSNGVWPVHYEVTSSTTANPNKSLRTPVDVHVAVTTLPDPVIQDTVFVLGIEYIACPTIKNIPVVGRAAVVHVAGGAPLAEGMVLDFTWTGSNPNGPVAPYEFQKTLTGNEHAVGFDVYLPFTDALVPIRDGSGSIIYETTIGSRLEMSNRHSVEVVVVDAGGGLCSPSVTNRKFKAVKGK